ncbi:hypothetical protein [Selenomonas sp. AE3005]|uniref:portal protein n=1 Tax=Selenomonas sp. AE3005 TaxID=1485543 RepID=UPI00047FA55C|nr:hypothetical protein [Selenomonas sp. AE3005]
MDDITQEAPQSVGLNTGIQETDSERQIEPDEVSLDTLSKEEKDKILRAFKQGKDVANNYYKTEVEPKIIKRMELYKADKNLYKKKFPALSELNNWVSKDIKTTVDWILPNLIEVFNGTESPVEIQGQSIEDDDNAKLLQQLIDYFVTKKNNFFTFLYTFAKDGLVTNFAVAKVYWNREEERQPMQVMADARTMQILLLEQENGRIEIKNIKPVDAAGDYLLVDFDIIHVKSNTPILENMNPSELRFTHEERDIHDAKFVAHRKIVRGDYLKRKELEHVYQNVDEALEKAEGKPSYTTLDIKHDKRIEDVSNKLSDGDTASKEYELYEAYLKVDYNNDGVYEKIIVHVVGDTLLKVQKNTFEIPPFFVFSPEYEPYAVFNEEGFADAWEQLQDLKTALVRQIVINTAKNNRGQKFVNDSVVDMDALMDGDEYVPIRDGKNPAEAVMFSPPIPTDPSAMTLIQYVQNELESQSGSTRYNQGLDSKSLNMTATGISAIMGAADKKIKLIARILAETAWIPIIKFLVLLCQKFVDDGQVIRLLNQNIVVRRDQLNIDYDLVVNVGQGAGTKEAGIQYKLMMIQQLYPVLQNVGIVTPQSWYSIVKDLLEDLGIRTTTKYLLDPNSPEFQQMQAQQQQAAQMEQQKQEALVQAQLQLKEKDINTKLATNLSAKWNELPVDAKVQALAAIGIQTTPDSVAANDSVLRDFQLEQARARSWGYNR